MPLIELDPPFYSRAIPDDVRALLAEADRQVDGVLAGGGAGGFVPSDYVGAYRLLRGVSDSGLARGPSFCEWGSGLGVVACLAAMLGYDACGIEAEGGLVDRARSLAEDFGLGVEFAHGSFVPRGGERGVHAAGAYSWLTTEGDYAYEDLGRALTDMDVVFAYPWPDEEAVIGELFDRYAGPGAILATFHGSETFRLRRKVRRR